MKYGRPLKIWKRQPKLWKTLNFTGGRDARTASASDKNQNWAKGVKRQSYRAGSLYSARESKLSQYPKSEVEGVNHSPKQVILSILQKELQMDTVQIRFHAVHRIAKRKENKHRPIIARFVCGEDRDQVFARKKGIKESTRFKDAYRTADYAKAIQDERRKLIKAIFKLFNLLLYFFEQLLMYLPVIFRFII